MCAFNVSLAQLPWHTNQPTGPTYLFTGYLSIYTIGKLTLCTRTVRYYQVITKHHGVWGRENSDIHFFFKLLKSSHLRISSYLYLEANS